MKRTVYFGLNGSPATAYLYVLEQGRESEVPGCLPLRYLDAYSLRYLDAYSLRYLGYLPMCDRSMPPGGESGWRKGCLPALRRPPNHSEFCGYLPSLSKQDASARSIFVITLYPDLPTGLKPAMFLLVKNILQSHMAVRRVTWPPNSRL